MSVLITLSVVCLNFLCIYFSFLSKIWILLLLLLLLSLLLLLILILMLLSLLILLLLGEFLRLYLFLRIVVLDLWIIREILVREFSSLVLVLHIIIKVIINIFFTFSVHVSFFFDDLPQSSESSYCSWKDKASMVFAISFWVSNYIFVDRAYDRDPLPQNCSLFLGILVDFGYIIWLVHSKGHIGSIDSNHTRYFQSKNFLKAINHRH